MSMFDIVSYLNSLPDNIKFIDISNKGITYLPDLTRFKNLKALSCFHNKLKSLPTLPENLKYLSCFNNELTYLPYLPENLEILHCDNNELTCLPKLPKKIYQLHCYNNPLTCLPDLPENLKYLCCYNNGLTYLPTLPDNLYSLNCHNNQIICLPNIPENLEILYFWDTPIYNLIYEKINNNNLFAIKQKIRILNNFRYLYYSLKFKNRFKKLLWETIREPKIIKKYHPDYLIEHLQEDSDLEIVLENWINRK
jgi:hypothetical protein